MKLEPYPPKPYKSKQDFFSSLVSTTEAARMFGVGNDLMYRWTSEEIIRPVMIYGNFQYFSPLLLNTWKHNHHGLYNPISKKEKIMRTFCADYLSIKDISNHFALSRDQARRLVHGIEPDGLVGGSYHRRVWYRGRIIERAKRRYS